MLASCPGPMLQTVASQGLHRLWPSTSATLRAQSAALFESRETKQLLSLADRARCCASSAGDFAGMGPQQGEGPDVPHWCAPITVFSMM